MFWTLPSTSTATGSSSSSSFLWFDCNRFSSSSSFLSFDCNSYGLCLPSSLLLSYVDFGYGFWIKRFSDQKESEIDQRRRRIGVRRRNQRLISG
ncbi:hypothetical protein L6452_41962 [Arctium lappa]|uniref:Uncharacterized protein n=1 Tax=Arctium lappa TaxID=4217 RepID=A0ACB8XI42_ARCLA|nr:hypothetical protein L6452_41962 [Arctium lappa]